VQSFGDRADIVEDLPRHQVGVAPQSAQSLFSFEPFLNLSIGAGPAAAASEVEYARDDCYWATVAARTQQVN